MKRKLWWEANPRSASWGDRLDARLKMFDQRSESYLLRHPDTTCWWVRPGSDFAESFRRVLATAMQTHDGQFEYIMLEMERGLPRKFRLAEKLTLEVWFKAIRITFEELRSKVRAGPAPSSRPLPAPPAAGRSTTPSGRPACGPSSIRPGLGRRSRALASSPRAS